MIAPRGLALVAPLLAACLIAPSRPSERDAGTTPDAGSGTNTMCLGSGDVLGPAAVLPAAGGAETLYRVGMRDGAPVVYRFDPPVRDTRCAAQIYPLPDAGGAFSRVTSADSIEAEASTVALGSDALIVGLSRGPNAEVDVVTFPDDGLHVVTLEAPDMAPQVVDTFDPGGVGSGMDHPAFVHFDDASHTVWIGGGATLGGAAYDGVSDLLPAALAGSGNPQGDVWYAMGSLAMPGGDHGSDTLALSGASSTYIAQWLGQANALANVQSDEARQHDTCPGGAGCSPRVARAAGRPTPPYSVVSIMRDQPNLEIVAASGDVTQRSVAGTARPGSPYVIADLDADDFAGTGEVDLATLWVDAEPGNPPEVYVYGDLLRSTADIVVGKRFLVDANHANVTRLATLHAAGGVPTLLLLSDHPGTDAELCIVRGSDREFAPCE